MAYALVQGKGSVCSNCPKKVESQTKNIDPLLLSNLIELWKSLFPVVAEEKMTMETFKEINTFYKQRVLDLKGG